MRTTDARRNGGIIAIGPLPPPVHGYSLVTAFMIERLQRAAAVDVCDVAPPGLIKGWTYHATRILRVARALWKVIRGPARGGTLYLAVAGGAGVVYDISLAVAARLRGYRIFIHHNTYAYLTRWCRWTAMLTAVAGAEATHICLCPAMARRLSELYPWARQTMILSNAALIAPVGTAPPPLRAGLRIGFLGNLIPEKGLDTALAVLEALYEKRADITLIVAGPILDSATRHVIDIAGQRFGGAFDYRGAVYGTEKTRFFYDIDALLFPSRYANEAQPLVVLEALAHGVPVVATARGCISNDLAAGGIVVQQEGEFVRTAVAAILDWRAAPATFSQLRAAAYQHSIDMHRSAQAELAGLIDLIGQGETPVFRSR